MFFKSYTKLEKWLNEKLAKVLKMQPLTEKNLPQNLLVVGETGTGKTAIIRKWAELNNLNLFDIDVSFWMDYSQDTVNRYLGRNKGVAEILSKPNTVLFLDWYDCGTEKSRSFFSDLLERHIIHTEDGDMFLPNVLFAIAVAWPNPELHTLVTSPLTDNEKQKFDICNVQYDKEEYLCYSNALFNELIECAEEQNDKELVREYQGDKALMNFILKDPKFSFGSDNLKTTYISFTNCLMSSNGTKKDFLKSWDSCCDSKQKSIIEEILRNYQDIAY